MAPPCLHVISARFNPIRWRTPDRTYRDWVAHILDSGARLTVVEVQYGELPFQCEAPHVNHVGLRAESWAWCKECAINQALYRLPDAKYLAWGDADIWHRQPNWVADTLDHLQHYRVVQTWTSALDLGPADDILAVHKSFCSQYQIGAPLVPEGPRFWSFDGGYATYPHSGFFWAAKRDFFDAVGGLFELGGMGSADHHMALALIGQVERSWPATVSASYRASLLRWQNRAQRFVNGRLGALRGTIEHRFHGAKHNRGYQSRWDMFVRHGFDPDVDLRRNCYGILEWAGNKPELERQWDQYLRSRREDDNHV